MNTDFWREETPLNSTNNFYSMQHSPLKRIKQVDLYTEMAREGRYGLERDQLKDGCDQLIKHTQKDATSIRNCEQRTNGECSSKASRDVDQELLRTYGDVA